MAVPRATYRLQLHEGFTFDDAAALAPYLAELGVTHAYLSPILQSAAGSEHGYDCVDPESIDPQRGGADGWARLRAACDAHGLGIVLDIVPNHLDVSSNENRWWHSVLELGPASPWAHVFDIDWSDEDVAEEDAGVLVPVLGEPMAEAMDEARITLERSGGSIMATYFDHVFPLSPASQAELLEEAGAAIESTASRSVIEACIHELGELDPGDGSAGGDADEERLAEIARRLGTLFDGEAAAGRAVDRALEAVVEDGERFNELLRKQSYRLAFWRRAARELNYRRFFNINTLAGVRIEDETVFLAVHSLILKLFAEGAIDGLRIDHPDGLRDPRQYFERLRERMPKAWIVAEKILETGEPLRSEWPVDGTTGYDFLNDVLGVLIDPQAEEAFDETYAAFRSREAPLHELIFEAKLFAATDLLAADLNRLTSLLEHIADAHDRTPCERNALRQAIALVAACTHVYRPYIVPERGEMNDEDRTVVESAIEEASRRRPDLIGPAITLVRDALRLELDPSPAPPDPFGMAHAPEHDFVARFQQYSAPVMAKGVEDTAFYRYQRFIALNEVGGDPGRFGFSAERFHERNRARAKTYPTAMLGTSTHDTKRSEDVRARLAALTETPEAWAHAVEEWREMTAPFRTHEGVELDGEAAYLFHQSVVGAWPIDTERMTAFMLKAVREAKVHTRWVGRNEAYEATLKSFIEQALGCEAYRESVERFVGSILRAGRINGLTQTLLKLASPGAPDIYQGCELWDLSLVDPDNRRPVDFELRKRLLASIESQSAADIAATLEDPDDPGLAKLFLTWRALEVRERHAAAFEPGSTYEALAADGAEARRVIAFSRKAADSGRAVIAIAQRFSADLDDWGDTAIELPNIGGREWKDALSGRSIVPGRVLMKELLADFPAALLAMEGA